LSTCYSIIRKHGGYIGVRSVVGKGTTFGVVLPALCEQFPEAEPVTTDMPTGEVSDTSPMILVMDDEELIRSLGLEFLQLLGCQGQACSDGKEAIALFKDAAAAGRPFAAVILDLTVPGGVGGKDAAEQILAIDPHARMIVSSGYSDDPVMADYKRYGFCDVLAKPYTVDRMAQVLRGVVSFGQRGITAP
jgi:CheY-like chemotaxis protein